MKTDYQLSAAILANTTLTLPDSVILNDIIGIVNASEKPFIGTDTYLSKKFGISTPTVERAIKHLKSLNILEADTNRRKHIEGDKEWYNKRYITVNFEALRSVIAGELPAPITEHFAAPQVEVPTSIETTALVEVAQPDPAIETTTIPVINSSNSFFYGFHDDDDEVSDEDHLAQIDAILAGPQITRDLDQDFYDAHEPEEEQDADPIVDLEEVGHILGYNSDELKKLGAVTGKVVKMSPCFNHIHIKLSDLIAVMGELRKQSQFKDYAGPRIDDAVWNNLKKMVAA
ncbi:MAG: hypothetical protein EOO51_14580 [Flavobacterium sp.]|nr:MAG: hypothetical protein EOO51_14580 [Flavobacterium sp.]